MSTPGASTYDFSISMQTLNGKVNPSRLSYEIRSSSIVSELQNVLPNYGADVVICSFKNPLSSSEQATLTGIVAAHNGLSERIIQGRIDTTSPTILSGEGFSIVKNSTGNITVTFTLPFATIPAITVGNEGLGIAGLLEVGTPTTGEVQLLRNNLAALPTDGPFGFCATGLV